MCLHGEPVAGRGRAQPWAAPHVSWWPTPVPTKTGRIGYEGIWVTLARGAGPNAETRLNVRTCRGQLLCRSRKALEGLSVTRRGALTHSPRATLGRHFSRRQESRWHLPARKPLTAAPVAGPWSAPPAAAHDGPDQAFYLQVCGIGERARPAGGAGGRRRCWPRPRNRGTMSRPGPFQPKAFSSGGRAHLDHHRGPVREPLDRRGDLSRIGRASILRRRSGSAREISHSPGAR